MELLIVICLFIIIALLLKDKFVVNRKSGHQPKQQQTNPELPDIMGQPKPAKSYAQQKATTQEKAAKPMDSLVSIAVPDAEKVTEPPLPYTSDEIPSTAIDLSEEEEDWGGQGRIPNEGFATGVTFDELATVGKLLEQDTVESAEKEAAIIIASKIEGTELLGLLESKIGDASKKIAMLLDRSLTVQGTKGSFVKQADAQDTFDIGDYA